MKNLVYFLVATVCWLGLFEQHLIQPLLLLPVGAVLEVLTGFDYLLWAMSFIAVAILDRIIDHVSARNGPPVTPVYEVLRKVKKRGVEAKRKW